MSVIFYTNITPLHPTVGALFDVTRYYGVYVWEHRKSGQIGGGYADQLGCEKSALEFLRSLPAR